jgi:hypothetical protein
MWNGNIKLPFSAWNGTHFYLHWHFKGFILCLLVCNLSTYFIDVVTTARKVEQGLMKLGKVRNSLVKFDVMSNDELEGAPKWKIYIKIILYLSIISSHLKHSLIL